MTMKKMIKLGVLGMAVWGLGIACQKESALPLIQEGAVVDPAGQEYPWKRLSEPRGKAWILKNLNYDIPGYNSWWYDNDPDRG